MTPHLASLGESTGEHFPPSSATTTVQVIRFRITSAKQRAALDTLSARKQFLICCAKLEGSDVFVLTETCEVLGPV